MNENDVLDVMDWARAECRRRGCTDTNVQMRSMAEARRNLINGIELKDVQGNITNSLRIAGFFVSYEEREQYLAEKQRQAEAMELLVTESNKKRRAT
jgi:hypothetical protein